MIIRDAPRRRAHWGRWLGILSIPLLLGAVLWLLAPGGDPNEATFEMQCSAETTIPAGEGLDGSFFISDGDTFLNGHTASNIDARTGRNSSMVGKDQPYGLGYQFLGLQGGERYEIRVWRKAAENIGELVFDGEWKDYKGTKAALRTEGDWSELRLTFEVPWFITDGRAKVYCFQNGGDYVFFDDMKIRCLRGANDFGRTAVRPDSIAGLNLVIDDEDWAKLERKRQEALGRGVLVTAADDYVDARLENDGKRYDAKIRLKGDWTDHLLGDKWSYRVKLDAGQSWNRLTTFSLQSPYTRSFLMEYVFHRWMQMEDLLAPRYDFVLLSINGKSVGVYALEEHFVKTLPEYNHRREGPILKFVEGGFWEVQENFPMLAQEDIEERVPIFQSAEIEPFSAKKTLKDSALAGQFAQAQRIMQQYKEGQADVWETFDAEKVARYFAIVDLMQAHHGFIWHNQRLYYNPLLNKLEPIGYDGFTEAGPLIWIKKPFIGYAKNYRYMSPAYKGLMFERFFTDYRFMDRYVHYLEHFSRPAYLDSLMLQLQPEIALREEQLREEWPNYEYNRNFIHERAQNVRMVLFPLRESSVKAYLREEKEGRFTYQIYNYHGLPVRLLGVGKKDVVKGEFAEKPVIPAFLKPFSAEMLEVETDRSGKWIHFEVPGLDSVFRAAVIPHPAPRGPSASQELFAGVTPQTNSVWEVDAAAKQIVIQPGRHTSRDDLIVPAGYKVLFRAGAQLDLVEGAAFISRSEVRSLGSPDQPVTITSSDGSARGFTILQVPDGEKSEFTHTYFSDLRNLNRQGWVHTGAVSVVESEVFFTYCRFVGNRCEDGLNVVRSVLTLDHCHFAETFSDALDADFCTVSLTACTFFNAGNDAMDFSGSQVYLRTITVEGAGDKGLSLGEESTAEVGALTIRNAVAGIASKDFSYATVDWLSLENVRQGLAVYQKKPEYGPATLEINTLKQSEVDQLYQVQPGSHLVLEGEKIIGK